MDIVQYYSGRFFVLIQLNEKKAIPIIMTQAKVNLRRLKLVKIFYSKIFGELGTQNFWVIRGGIAPTPNN